MSDATGNIRRMDAQGRITIPPDIRRSLNLVPGDPLEIHTRGNGIQLTKYSTLRTMLVQGEAHIKSIAYVYGAKCMICDTDKVITAAGGEKLRAAIGQPLSAMAAKMLRKDKEYIPASYTETFAPVERIQDVMTGAIMPLHSDGLLCGGMILCVRSGCMPTDAHLNALRYVADVLNRQYRW